MNRNHGMRTAGAALAVLCLLWTLVLPSLAAAQTADLITLEETTDLVVIVTYDTEEPEIAFLSPDGTRYAEEMGNLSVERGNMTLYFHLKGAQPGAWQITYDKKSNRELTVNFARDVQSLFLTELTIQPPEYDRVQVAFQTEYPEQTSCSYIVYAVLLSPEGQVTGQKELTSGTTRTNQETKVSAPLRELATYDNYRIMVEVYLERGGVEVFDSAVSQDSFAYENSNTPSAMGNMDLTVDLADDDLTVDWSAWKVYGCENYLLAVFRQGEEEPFFYQEYAGDILNSSVLIERTYGTLRVDLTYRRSGRMSQTLSRTVDLSQADWVGIATPEDTNAAQARVDYSVPQPLQARVEVNGQTNTLRLEGDSFFSVPMVDGVNQLSVSYAPEEHLTFVERRQINCDRIAPELRLFQADGVIHTDSASYLLAGQAERGCVLTVGGQETALEADGTFLQELALSPGENRFEVVLTDPAGNQTRQELTIERSRTQGGGTDTDGPAWQNWLPLLLTLGGSLLALTAGLLLFRRGKDGKRRVAGPLSVLLWMVDLLLLGAAGYCAFRYFTLSAQVNSSAFLEMAQASISQAYALLEQHAFFSRWSLRTGCAAAALLAVNVIWTMLRRRKKKKEKPDAIRKDTEEQSDRTEE